VVEDIEADRCTRLLRSWSYVMDVIFLEEQDPTFHKRQTNLAKVWRDLLPSEVTDVVIPMLNDESYKY